MITCQAKHERSSGGSCHQVCRQDMAEFELVDRDVERRSCGRNPGFVPGLS